LEKLVWHCAFDGSVDPEQLMRALKQKAGAMSQDTEVTHVDHNRVEVCVCRISKLRKSLSQRTHGQTGFYNNRKFSPLERKPFAQARWLRGKSPTTIFLMNLAYVRVCKDRRLVVGGMRSLAPEIEETEQLELNPLIQGALL
jgi:hypothetical protein